MKLLRWDNNEIIYENKNINNVKELVEEAVKKGINLSYAYLYKANLSYAYLENAYLYKANLENANLNNANLNYANLENANLYKAYLYNANLYNANLNNANLNNVDLNYANLENANLKNVDLSNADLSYAYLYKANLYNANLNNANLKNVDLSEFIITPEGDWVCWKKVSNNYILKLLVPENARRVNRPGSRKCRVEFAKVLEIWKEGIKINNIKQIGGHRNEFFIYTIGEVVYPDKYCDDIRLECSNGIHVFLTKKEAERY